MSEPDTLPQGGTDNAQPSDNFDNPANWDYYDPDDERDTVAPEAPKGNESEANEGEEEAQEVAQSASDDEETQEEVTDAPAPADKAAKTSAIAPDTALISMPDGSTITVEEARRGQLRQADYTRKTQGLAEQAQHVQRTVERIGEFLHQNIPPPPDMSLAVSDPQAYLAQQVQHEAALRQWQQIMSLQDGPKQVSESISREEYQKKFDTENEALIARLPQLADKQARDQFSNRVLEVAQIAGVTKAEINGIVDHRYIVLLDYAVKGFAAEKAKKLMNEKVATAPPVTPPRRQQPANSAAKVNRDAMRRLSQSGSIRDAMNVDFD